MNQDIEQLAQQYYADPSPENRKAMVLGSLRLIRAIINRLSVPDRMLATYDDLQGVGLLGLMEAMERFDPSLGIQFTTFAYRRIHGSIVDYLRMIDELPRERREEVARAQHAIETLGQQYGTDPDDQAVASFLGISLREYHTIVLDAQSRYARSLHTATEEDSESLLEVMPNEDADYALARIEWNSDRDHIARLVKSLPEREQTILACYYEEELTLREIGTLLNISEARVSQLLSRTLRTLRRHLNVPDRIAA